MGANQPRNGGLGFEGLQGLSSKPSGGTLGDALRLPKADYSELFKSLETAQGQVTKLFEDNQKVDLLTAQTNLKMDWAERRAKASAVLQTYDPATGKVKIDDQGTTQDYGEYQREFSQGILSDSQALESQYNKRFLMNEHINFRQQAANDASKFMTDTIAFQTQRMMEHRVAGVMQAGQRGLATIGTTAYGDKAKGEVGLFGTIAQQNELYDSLPIAPNERQEMKDRYVAQAVNAWKENTVRAGDDLANDPTAALAYWGQKRKDFKGIDKELQKNLGGQYSDVMLVLSSQTADAQHRKTAYEEMIVAKHEKAVNDNLQAVAIDIATAEDNLSFFANAPQGKVIQDRLTVLKNSPYQTPEVKARVNMLQTQLTGLSKVAEILKPAERMSPAEAKTYLEGRASSLDGSQPWHGYAKKQLLQSISRIDKPDTFANTLTPDGFSKAAEKYGVAAAVQIQQQQDPQGRLQPLADIGNNKYLSSIKISLQQGNDADAWSTFNQNVNVIAKATGKSTAEVFQAGALQLSALSEGGTYFRYVPFFGNDAQKAFSAAAKATKLPAGFVDKLANIVAKDPDARDKLNVALQNIGYQRGAGDQASFARLVAQMAYSTYQKDNPNSDQLKALLTGDGSLVNEKALEPYVRDVLSSFKSNVKTAKTAFLGKQILLPSDGSWTQSQVDKLTAKKISTLLTSPENSGKPIAINKSSFTRVQFASDVQHTSARGEPLLRSIDNIAQQNGITVKVTSGYRTPEENKKAGGAEGSMHLSGRAVDLALLPLGSTRTYNFLQQIAMDGNVQNVIIPKAYLAKLPPYIMNLRGSQGQKLLADGKHEDHYHIELEPSGVKGDPNSVRNIRLEPKGKFKLYGNGGALLHQGSIADLK